MTPKPRVPVALLSVALSSAACSSTPPARWAEGGAPLALGRAHWQRGSDVVDVLEDGRVMIDGDTVWILDPVGRVYDGERDPVAVLHPEGFLAGKDERGLGHIGLANAAPPTSTAAWLTVDPATGQVIYYDQDGERHAAGVWTGCAGPVQRTCTLVTHLVILRDLARRPRVSVGVGVGFGMYR